MITRFDHSRARSTVIALVAALLAVAGAMMVIVRSTTAAMAAVGVEDDGANCPVSIPGTLTSNSMLPDPFRKPDGSRIATKADWRCQRAQIKALEQRFVYGDKPAKPQTVTGTVSSTSITVNVSHNGRSASFRGRGVRSAHRPDHADRVGFGRCSHLPRDPRRVRRPTAEQRRCV